MKIPSCLRLSTTWLVITGVTTSIPAQNWPQFRGEGGSGFSADARPPTRFGPAESIAWSVEVPWSPSSPVVWANRIFLTTFHQGMLETRCHDRSDGRLLWTRGVKSADLEEFHRSDGSPAASTPATDGHHVVSYFGSFGLLCHDLEGRELWRHPLPIAQSAGQYGSGTSPIIIGERVLLNRDQHRYSSLLAVDLKTGAKLWETHRPEAAGSFGTPAHWKNLEVDEVVLAASGRLKGYDVTSGAERWVIEGVTGYVCTTAVVGNGHLYFAAWSNQSTESTIPEWNEFSKRFDKDGDDEVAFEEIPLGQRDYWRGVDANRDGKYSKLDWDLRQARQASSVRLENVMIAVKPGGTGDISTSHVTWTTRRGLPYVPSPLYYDGRVYLVKDGGLLSSVDARTGESFYTQERIGANGNYYASPVAADGRLYLASLPGKMTVIKAGGAKPEILHQVDLGERIVATPVPLDNSLYVRTTNRLWAFRD